MRTLAKGEQIAAQLSRRLDNWINTLTGLGDATRDKVQSSVFVRDKTLTFEELEALYHGDDFAERIVAALPREAFRQGIVVKRATDDDADTAHEQIIALEKRMRSLDVVTVFQRAFIWSRLYGGAAIFLGVRDGLEASEPLRDETPGPLEFITDLDPRELRVSKTYTDATSEKYGKPETWGMRRGDAREIEVHETRLVFFDGVLTSEREKTRNRGWSHSILQRLYPTLRAANSNFDSVTHMMTDMSQAVFKVHGLIDAIANGHQDVFLSRMRLTNMIRSVSRAVIIDAEDEDFSVVERSAFTGTDAILDKSWLRLAAAARMPVAILLGQSPAGLNATGAIDVRWWYDSIQSERETYLQPRLEHIVRLLSGDLFPAVDADAWSIDWPSLWQSSPSEQADLRAKVATTDASYVASGVLLPEEIAIARFGRGEWSDGYDGIDIESRKRALEMDLENPAAGGDDTEEESTPETSDRAPTPATDKAIAPETALNGAQVSSLLDLLERVRTGTIPKASAQEIMLAAFAMDVLQASRILAPIEVTPEAEPAAPVIPDVIEEAT